MPRVWLASFLFSFNSLTLWLGLIGNVLCYRIPGAAAALSPAERAPCGRQTELRACENHRYVAIRSNSVRVNVGTICKLTSCAF